MIRPVTAADTPTASRGKVGAARWSADRALKRLESQPPDRPPSAQPALADSTLAHLTNCLAQALPETKSAADQIKADLQRAGDHTAMAYQKLGALRYAGMILSLAVFGGLTIFAPRRAEPFCLAGVAIGMAAAWWLPVWRLRRRAARRIGEIDRGISDLCDLVEVCLNEGLTVSGALATATRELRPVHPALAAELVIVCRRSELTSLETALEEFEQRSGLPEVRALVTRLLDADNRRLSRFA
jgi:tight adherence protein C